MTQTERAIKELKLAGLFDENSDYGGMIGDSVKELLEVFGKQGHSGASAPRVAGLFKVLANGGNLIPLTGEEDEWTNHIDEKTYQNKRCSAMFKDEDEKGNAYYLDAIVWKGEDTWDTFTGTIDGITSRQYVKFPFTPKTFYIDVVRELYDKKKHKDSEDIVQCGSGKYVYSIKDKKQLDEVYKHYLREGDFK